MSYQMTRNLSASYDQALARTRDALQAEGFGVLTEIDVKTTLKQKLDVDFRRYIILGACNPPFAYQALLAEPDIGLLLPCNVVVQESGEGSVKVSAIDPVTAMQVVGNDRLESIASEISKKLTRVLENL